MVQPIPDYKNLDLSGEAQLAAARMEARAQEPASQAMFDTLILPLLNSHIHTALEFGCGTAALSRRIARAVPQAAVYATDKSEGMLKAAAYMIAQESLRNVHLQTWDILDEASFPFPLERFDLIISSVVVPYLDDQQTASLVQRLITHLAPGGVLAFMEQDLATDSVNMPRFDLYRAILAKDQRNLKRTLALGLRSLLKEGGLELLPRRSFLWTDDCYSAYTRDLLERMAEAACDRSAISSGERDLWKMTLNDLAESGDFYYGIVYHLVGARYIVPLQKEA